MDAPFIGRFLDHVEKDRGNTPQTRNVRLAAIHSFFNYLALQEPSLGALAQRVLAIPGKRHKTKPVDFLTRDEIDALLEAVTEVHKGNWRLVQSAAQNHMNIPHQGFIVAGKFYRGNQRGGGKVVNAIERDRVRALQLMVQAMPLALKDPDHAEVSSFLLALAVLKLHQCSTSSSRPAAVGQASVPSTPSAPPAASAVPAVLPAPSAPPAPLAAASQPPAAATAPIAQPLVVRPNARHGEKAASGSSARAAPGATGKPRAQPLRPAPLTPTPGAAGKDVLLPLGI